jgi:cytochrome c5
MDHTSVAELRQATPRFGSVDETQQRWEEIPDVMAGLAFDGTGCLPASGTEARQVQ